MGLNVYAVRARAGAVLEDLPVGRNIPVIGTTEDVVERVRQAAPHVDATDLPWLTFNGDDHAIEMFLGKNVHVREITFYLRSGQGAVAVVLDVCRALGVTPFETESGERLTTDSARPAPLPDEPKAKRWWRR